jgi:glycerol-3-phosphate dehydrogenase
MFESDIAVIGGGIFGLSAADAFAKHGYSVALYERDSIHHATSNNSHRIIHGGLRYLQSFDLKRLARSLAAKQYCLETFPDHIVPLNCSLVVSGRGAKRASLLAMAGLGYGFLSTLLGFPTEWCGLAPESNAAQNRFFQNLTAKKFFQWTDARMRNPSSLADHLAQSFLEHGGAIREQLRVSAIRETDSAYEIMCDGQRVGCAKLVILCLGPWSDSIELPCDLRHNFDEKALAFNVVLKQNLVGDHALAVESERTRQMLFFAPREISESSSIQSMKTAVGTWYLPLNGTVENSMIVPQDKIESVLNDINETISPPKPLTLEDVYGVECGVLPVRGFKGESPQFYGSDEMITRDGIASVMSTKYTTFSQTAQELVQWVRSHSEITPRENRNLSAGRMEGTL